MSPTHYALHLNNVLRRQIKRSNRELSFVRDSKDCRNFSRARVRYKETHKFGISNSYGSYKRKFWQFIDGIRYSDMRLRSKQARPTDLNDTVRHAVELQVFQSADKKMQERQDL